MTVGYERLYSNTHHFPLYSLILRRLMLQLPWFDPWHSTRISISFLTKRCVPISIFLPFYYVAYLHFSQSLSTCMFSHVQAVVRVSLTMSITKFVEGNNFPFLSAIFAHLLSTNSIWISPLTALAVCSCFRRSSSVLPTSFSLST